MANSTETKVQVLVDKLQVLMGSGGFDAMSPVDRKLMLQYVSQLKDYLQILVGSPELTATRMPEPKIQPVVHTAEPIVTPSPPSIQTPPIPKESLPDEVLRELGEVKKAREQYEKVRADEALKEESRKKSINTIAREKQPPASLHERFAGIDEKHLGEQLKHKPISSLSTGINLNDRIWFVKELFAGNQQAYDSAIRKLDSAGSFTAAKQLFDDLSLSSKWQPNDLSVTKFFGLVRRRFGQT